MRTLKQNGDNTKSDRGKNVESLSQWVLGTELGPSNWVSLYSFCKNHVSEVYTPHIAGQCGSSLVSVLVLQCRSGVAPAQDGGCGPPKSGQKSRCVNALTVRFPLSVPTLTHHRGRHDIPHEPVQLVRLPLTFERLPVHLLNRRESS